MPHAPVGIVTNFCITKHIYLNENDAYVTQRHANYLNEELVWLGISYQCKATSYPQYIIISNERGGAVPST